MHGWILNKLSGFAKSLFLSLIFSVSALCANQGHTKSPEFDCSGFVPFEPIESLRADVKVYRLRKYIPDQGTVPVDEAEELVCSTNTPLVVDVKDIRGREKEWYFCNITSEQNFISCPTEYKSKPAKIIVRPAMVIRSWKPSDALDSHMHVYLLPEGDESRLLDNFTQSLSFDLNQREITLSGSSGGKAPNSDQDYFYVRVRIYK